MHRLTDNLGLTQLWNTPMLARITYKTLGWVTLFSNTTTHHSPVPARCGTVNQSIATHGDGISRTTLCVWGCHVYLRPHLRLGRIRWHCMMRKTMMEQSRIAKDGEGISCTTICVWGRHLHLRTLLRLRIRWHCTMCNTMALHDGIARRELRKAARISNAPCPNPMRASALVYLNSVLVLVLAHGIGHMAEHLALAVSQLLSAILMGDTQHTCI